MAFLAAASSVTALISSLISVSTWVVLDWHCMHSLLILASTNSSVALLTCWLPGKELDRLLLSVLSITLHSCFSSLSISELSSLSHSGKFVYKGLGMMATGPRFSVISLLANFFTVIFSFLHIHRTGKNLVRRAQKIEANGKDLQRHHQFFTLTP